MGIFEKLFGIGKTEKRSAEPYIALERAIHHSGGRDAALRLAVSSRCIDLISGNFSVADVNFYREAANGAPEKINSHPLAKLLLNGTDSLSAQELKRRIMESYVSAGEAFLRVVWDSNGQPIDLIPLDNRNVTVELTGRGSMIYRWQDPLKNHVETVFTANDVCHLKHRPIGGRGRSPGDLAGISMSYNAALNETLRTDAEAGIKMSGVLSAPGAISDETASRLKADMQARYSGASGKANLLVLGDGLALTGQPRSFSEQEMLESKRLGLYEIAAAFSIPPDAAGLPFHSTWSSAAEANRQLVVSLRVWSQAVLQQMLAYCLGSRERSKIYAESDFGYMIQGSLQERATAWASLLGSGALTVDEVRREMDLAPLPDGAGATARVPLNTAAVGKPDATTIGGAS